MKRPSKKEIKQSFVKLLKYTPGYLPACPKGHIVNAYHESKKMLEDDSQAPFFSEAYLYTLMGKEEARSVLGLIRNLADACGVDLIKLEEEQDII
jgi:hypothetical protein